jgi:hypothetical protein
VQRRPLPAAAPPPQVVTMSGQTRDDATALPTATVLVPRLVVVEEEACKTSIMHGWGKEHPPAWLTATSSGAAVSWTRRPVLCLLCFSLAHFVFFFRLRHGGDS